MTALTKGRDTVSRVGRLYSCPVAAGAMILQGAMVCLEAAGNAVPGSNTGGLKVRGRAEEPADNTAGAAGDVSVPVLEGEYLWENDGTIDRTHIGTVATVIDDQTVGTGGASDAGMITDVVDAGVWVRTEI